MRYGSEVHRYVGDEVILTWTAEEGLLEARCVRAVFAISDTLEAARTAYEADFGVMPRFWAGLHLGPVVAGEIGTIKHEIAFLGDTLNAAARIQQACKELQREVLRRPMSSRRSTCRATSQARASAGSNCAESRTPWSSSP